MLFPVTLGGVGRWKSLYNVLVPEEFEADVNRWDFGFALVQFHLMWVFFSYLAFVRIELPPPPSQKTGAEKRNIG